MTSNFLRFAVLSGIVELFLFLGTLIISVIMTFVGYLILRAYGHSFNVEYETFGPLIVIFIIAFVITSMFNHVFEISSDSMLHCYVLDESLNKGKATHMSQHLSEIVNNMNDHQKLNG